MYGTRWFIFRHPITKSNTQNRIAQVQSLHLTDTMTGAPPRVIEDPTGQSRYRYICDCFMMTLAVSIQQEDGRNGGGILLIATE